MIDIVERLRFDAARCEVGYSKGVAGNITEAADLIEQMRSALLWIDNTDPEMVAAAEKKFGFKLVEPRGAK